MMPRSACGRRASGTITGGGAASFLGQAAATAAGVAGGAFLFEGIENLFGPHGASWQHAHAGDEPDRFTDDDDAAESDSDSGNDDGDFVPRSASA